MEIVKTTLTQELSIDGPDLKGIVILRNNNVASCRIEVMFEGKVQQVELHPEQIKSLCKEFGEVLNFINTQNKKECTQSSQSTPEQMEQ